MALCLAKSGFWTGFVWIVLSVLGQGGCEKFPLDILHSDWCLEYILMSVFLGRLLWFETKKGRITIMDHFDAVRRAFQLSNVAKESSPSRAMLVIIRHFDGTIEHIDSKLLDFLGYSRFSRPKRVCEIFEQKSWSKFAVTGLRAVVGDLTEDLFDVSAKKADNSFVPMRVAVHRVSDFLSEIFIFNSSPDLERPKSRPISDSIPRSKQVHVEEELSCDEAFVILLTIVKNRAFSQSSSNEVIAWMSRMHKIIEDQLKHHSVRLIETRCDSFIALTTARDGPRPASRAVLGASAIARAALAEEKTAIRSGVACGQATVARLTCPASGGGEAQLLFSAGGGSGGGGGGEGGGGGGGEAQLLFGDVANVAGRLEQSGDAASVHVCGRTARSFAEEQGIACPPIEVRAPLFALDGGEFGGTQTRAH